MRIRLTATREESSFRLQGNVNLSGNVMSVSSVPIPRSKNKEIPGNAVYKAWRCARSWPEPPCTASGARLRWNCSVRKNAKAVKGRAYLEKKNFSCDVFDRDDGGK